MSDPLMSDDVRSTVSFNERMLSSDAFMGLFREGMGLVEQTAAYLDGDGRQESRALDRIAALTYASESMRLTTRLMQMTSWLLLQRAVREGELSAAEAEEEQRKVKLRREDAELSNDNLAMLPETLADLISRTQRLYARILRLDGRMISEERKAGPAENLVAAQLGAIQAAFGVKIPGG